MLVVVLLGFTQRNIIYSITAGMIVRQPYTSLGISSLCAACLCKLTEEGGMETKQTTAKECVGLFQ
jgi:hypothetical protein